MVDVVPSEKIVLANFYFSSVFDLGLALGPIFAGSAAMIISTPTIMKITAVLVSSGVFVIAFSNFSPNEPVNNKS